VLVSTVLSGLDARVAGVHVGRIDAVYLVGGLIVIAGGVYFGVVAGRLPKVVPAIPAQRDAGADAAEEVSR